MAEPLLSRKQVAELLGVHPHTVTAWADKGILPPDRRLPGRGDRQWKQSTVEKVLASMNGES